MVARILNILLGLYIMASPALFHYSQALSDNNHIAGPLIITFAVIALWDINRQVRLANVVTGGWLILSVFLFSAPAAIYLILQVAAGLLIIVFSLIKGKVVHQYGGGWRSLWQNNPEHMQKASDDSSPVHLFTG